MTVKVLFFQCDNLGAVSSFENSGFDDDDDSQADWSASNFEKPLERPQHGEASYMQHDFSSSASDDNSRDGDYVDNETKLNSKNTLYTRKNYCYVCGAGVSKISRHLLKHADEEPDILPSGRNPMKEKSCWRFYRTVGITNTIKRCWRRTVEC